MATKTKVVVVAKKSPEILILLTARNMKIEPVQHFNYFRSRLTTNAKCKIDTIQSIALAKSSFKGMNNIFKDRKLSISLKIRLLNLSGQSSHTLASPEHLQQKPKKLKVAEIWFYRRILYIP